ncbi:hypothetical protein OROHE_001091 [Orobanche hederae]
MRYPTNYLTDELVGQPVLIRGHAQAIHTLGTEMVLVVVREGVSTVLCVLTLSQDVVSRQMLKFATSLTPESIVDVEGIVCLPSQPNTVTSQQVEIQVRKLYRVGKDTGPLPFNFEEMGMAVQDGHRLVGLNQDAALIHRSLELRSAANQGIFSFKSQVQKIFMEFLLSEGFVWRRPAPELTVGFRDFSPSDYDETTLVSLAKSTSQLQHYQSDLISLGLGRVFVIGTAVDSSTMCEFTGIHVEMEIKEHYSEIIEIVDRLFVKMFDTLSANCAKEIEAIKRQYPYQELKYMRTTLRLTFEEGVQMLKIWRKYYCLLYIDEATDELNHIKHQAIKDDWQKYVACPMYGTEFYILHRYPLALRPFYTTPCHDDPNYSNSFDVFIRGVVIVQGGAPHIHDPEVLKQRANACGVEIETISSYIDSLRYGVPLHGGFGVGLERVLMLLCALGDVRKALLFPSYQQR